MKNVQILSTISSSSFVAMNSVFSSQSGLPSCLHKQTNHKSFSLCCHMRIFTPQASTPVVIVKQQRLRCGSFLSLAASLQLPPLFSSVFTCSVSGPGRVRGHGSPLVNDISILLIVTVSSLFWFEPTWLTDGVLPPQ